MQVAISGGLGFIGHHIGIKLRELGHEVIAIDNLQIGEHSWRRERANAQPYDMLISLDIQHIGDYSSKWNHFHPDVIVHLAAHPNQAAFDADPSEAWAKIGRAHV